jgi:sulfite exporter TauE/SafE
MGNAEWYITAFVMGLTGSLHCLGMCGPILLAVSGFYSKPTEMLMPQLFYHLGKLITYAFIGVCFGLLGQTVSLVAIQSKLLLFAGFFLISFSLFGVFTPSPLRVVEQKVTQTMGGILKWRGGGSFFLGFLNGAIPCGLVYSAAIGAVATQIWWKGSLFMIFFGIGTIPALFFVALSRWMVKIKPAFKNPYLKQIPALLLGLFLLAKGLSLGIPFLSPDLNQPSSAKNCCAPKR